MKGLNHLFENVFHGFLCKSSLFVPKWTYLFRNAIFDHPTRNYNLDEETLFLSISFGMLESKEITSTFL